MKFPTRLWLVLICIKLENIFKNDVIDYVEEDGDDIVNNDPINIVEGKDILLRRRGQQKRNKDMNLPLGIG